MRWIICLLFLLSNFSESVAQNAGTPPVFDVKAAQRFASLALGCVHKEYPNHISHTLSSDADAAPPRKLTPAFYGCYDWHSSVHGHWLLVRLARTFPDATFVPPAREALRQSLTAENLAQEAVYLRGEGRASFERPYGLAWLLQLVAELKEWDDPQAKEMAAHLQPLEEAALERLKNWLPKLSNPVRIGEHDQTAFGLGLILDYARTARDEKFAALVESKARQFFLGDKDCPLAYEPSGEDFLSPCLGEADLMRRVLQAKSLLTGSEDLFPKSQDRATVDGCSLWCRRIQVIRSWRTWMGLISAAPGCWRESLPVYRRATSGWCRSWQLPRRTSGLGWRL